jgi:hypothetical protein
VAKPASRQEFKLYIKTHNKTGLKYLGKTVAKDPHAYPGSGKYWKRHLKKHGHDFTTQILLITHDKNDLIETALFFSDIFNVVLSPDWANLKKEEGDGGWSHVNTNPELIKERSKTVQGTKNPMYGLKNEKSPIFGKKQTYEHKEKRLSKIRGLKRSDEAKKLMSQNHTKSATGKKWYHNPITNEQKRFFQGFELNGYIKGRPLNSEHKRIAHNV